MEIRAQLCILSVLQHYVLKEGIYSSSKSRAYAESRNIYTAILMNDEIEKKKRCFL
ncbi:hypothetical protein SAMN05421877_11094 [Sphingobacterium lactis]|uniref:Uncharacterized protein n=1 Tax=Sphingobacterium lactis TaxID=797291 RepID=A0A1H6BHF5_9SPHI|nr:hypothetical protein SAMN05421877_11094 [Sphingobacterium lactis]